MIPVILVLIGFGFSKIQFFKHSADRVLDPSAYPLKQRLITNNKVWNSTGNDFTPQQILSSLPSLSNSFDISYKDYSSSATATNISFFDDAVFEARLIKPYSPSRYSSYFIYQADRNKN